MTEQTYRQLLVLVFMVVWAVIIPVGVLVGLLLPTAWMAALNMHPHAPLWGWLSDTHVTRHGTALTIASWIPIYYMTLVSLWAFYYLAELVGVGYRSFRDALT
jgi:hypothetical protein